MFRAILVTLTLASCVMSSSPAAKPNWDSKKLLATIDDAREHELQKLSDTKGMLAGCSWGFAAASAGAAAIPGAGIVTGIVADLNITLWWLGIVSGSYGATDQEVIDQGLAWYGDRVLIDEGIKAGAQAVIQKVQSNVYDKFIDSTARQAAENATREAINTGRGALAFGRDGRAARVFWRRMAEQYIAKAVEGHQAAAKLEEPVQSVLEKLCTDAADQLGGGVLRTAELNKMLREILTYNDRTPAIEFLEEQGVNRILYHLEHYTPRSRRGIWTEVTVEDLDHAACRTFGPIWMSERMASDGGASETWSATYISNRLRLALFGGEATWESGWFWQSSMDPIEGVISRETTDEVAWRTAQAKEVASREYREAEKLYAEKLVERYSTSESVKEACEWIPLLGNAAGAGLALGMMRDLCGNVNQAYYDAAVAKVNKTYDSKAAVVKALAIAQQEADFQNLKRVLSHKQ